MTVSYMAENARLSSYPFLKKWSPAPTTCGNRLPEFVDIKIVKSVALVNTQILETKELIIIIK
jgi:hypothetical protein